MLKDKKLTFILPLLFLLLVTSVAQGADFEQPIYSFDVPSEGYAQVMFDQGYNLYQEGRKEEAIQFFVEAVTTKPNFTKAWFWLARTYQEEEMIDEAIWAWKKVVQLEPDNTQAKYFLEKCENWKKYGKDAWENYEQGYLKFENKDYSAAIKLFQQAISINPNMDKAYYWLGMAYFETKDYQNAIRALEKYLSLQPNDKAAQYWLKEAKARAK
ncbi:MAG: tetratricopeptide repeat protein [Candidatus Atribacteria bacterium]|mgnify:FL=1|nr:tetratricopeptide repeat protein [Candidatus Atribacteria bacterium]